MVLKKILNLIFYMWSYQHILCQTIIDTGKKFWKIPKITQAENGLRHIHFRNTYYLSENTFKRLFKSYYV